MHETIPPTRLILASTSPRRQHLLTDAGYRFEVVAPPVEEPHNVRQFLSPAALAEALAYFKARSVAEVHTDALVLGADTICAVNGEALGKPDDADHARQMLQTLSHNPHEVITGVALIWPDGGRTILGETTRVFMRPMTDQDIDAYLATGEWEGKAGAYAIQETADRYVERIEGSWTNVVGLPMELVTRMLPKRLRDRVE